MYLLYTYFIDSSGFVFKDNIENYIKNREKNSSKVKSSNFKLAVREMEELLQDPKANLFLVKYPNSNNNSEMSFEIL